MKKLITSLTVVLMAAFSVNAEESGYKVLEKPLAVSSDKVVMHDLFMFTCPHCQDFTPMLNDWLAKHKELEVRQAPLASGKQAILFIAMYEAIKLQKSDFTKADFMKFMQVKRTSMDQFKSDYVTLLSELGLNESDTVALFNEPSIQQSLEQNHGLVAQWDYPSVPALVINGKYLINPSTAGSFEQMLAVADKLISQEKAK